MEIASLGEADGLPPVDWAAVAARLDAGPAPAPDAADSRTTWLSAVSDHHCPVQRTVARPAAVERVSH